MKKVIAASAIVALLLIGVAAVAVAHSSLLAPNSSSNAKGENGEQDKDIQTSTQQGDKDDGQANQTSTQLDDDGDQGEQEGGLNLKVGQTLVFSDLTGHYNNLTNESSEDGKDSSSAGKATGSFTFKVTSVSKEGFNLTITSGNFSIGQTTYTVTGGTLTLDEDGDSVFGSGTASGGATFTIHVSGIHDLSTSSAEAGAIKLDVKVGSSGYQVVLGTRGSSGESSED